MLYFILQKAKKKKRKQNIDEFETVEIQREIEDNGGISCFGTIILRIPK